MDREDSTSSDGYVDEKEVMSDKEEALFLDHPIRKQWKLMPDAVEDEVVGVVNFSDEFRCRFGRCKPLFYEGSLMDALKDSILLPVNDRKLLAVYLHHDDSIKSNIFCSKVLCNVSVVDYLAAHFVVWGWDLTNAENKERLVNLVGTHFGSVAANTVMNFNLDELPVLLVITCSNGFPQILCVIHGHGVVNNVMVTLMEATERFEALLYEEINN